MKDLHEASSSDSTQISWKIWFGWTLAALATGFVGAVLTLLWQIEGLITFAFTGGLLLGSLQALVLRPKVAAKFTMMWILGTVLAWFIAMSALYLGAICVLVGSGLADGDTRPIGLVFSCIAGFAFGSLQQFSQPQRLFQASMWKRTNAVAWTLGSFVGGLIGFSAFEFRQSSVDRSLFSQSGLIAISLGIVTALLVIGVVSGFTAAISSEPHNR